MAKQISTMQGSQVLGKIGPTAVLKDRRLDCRRYYMRWSTGTQVVLMETNTIPQQAANEGS